ncbi:MAG TPA: hemerythrin domain-containing protein [Gemmatimonadaceae bacterium]|nr:hemerythrin domain-containing protein [Gemmatimonadaceae bacterium]
MTHAHSADDGRDARRAFLHRAAAATTGVALFGWGTRVLAEQEEEQVSANEDLMREHGVLKRALLIYRDAISRLDANQDIPPDALGNTAKLIKRFIEEYHEKQEEDYLFPRFEKAGQLVDLVHTLRLQHQRGRERTNAIIQLATPAGLKDPSSRTQLVQHMSLFVRMYEPHEAREDTVLFPAFKKLVSQHEYAALGEQFEKNERQMFGGDGFNMAVNNVAGLEQTLGLYDLAQFTPPQLEQGRR